MTTHDERPDKDLDPYLPYDCGRADRNLTPVAETLSVFQENCAVKSAISTSATYYRQTSEIIYGEWPSCDNKRFPLPIRNRRQTVTSYLPDFDQ